MISLETKVELYKSVVDITASHGQGIPSFMLKDEHREALDSLVSEGKVKLVTKTYSHLPDDEVIVLEGVYSIEEDISENDAPLSHFSFLRHLLGVSDKIPGLEIDKGMTDTEVCESEEGKPFYEKWLQENKEGLDALLDLKKNPPTYKESPLSDSEKNLLTSRGWYKDNLLIRECINQASSTIPDREEQIKVVQNLINLLSEDEDKHAVEIEKHKKDQEENISNLDSRRSLINRMKCMNQNSGVVKAFKDLL